MKQARIRIKWILSPSPDVKSQKIVCAIDDREISEILSASITSFDVLVNESSTVHVSLTANDGTYDSDAVVASFEIGDLTKPEPQSGITFEIVEIVEEKVPLL